MSHKDLWFAEYERSLYEAEDRLGRFLTQAEEDALASGAMDTVHDNLADAADNARKRKREEG